MSGKVLKSVQDLAEAGLIDAENRDALDAVAARYAIAITPAIQALIDPADREDPIAAQFVPQAEELTQTPLEQPDPIGDHARSPVPGIVHRYPDRVLLKVLHTCPVYCRFCFRREMVGPQGDGSLSTQEVEAALGYIRSHTEIWEVIFTGGDPLILSPRRLQALVTALAGIEHVKIIRFHSRVPVVDPQRIDTALIDALTVSGKMTYVAIHANHPRELTEDARQAVLRLRKAGIETISQTVLLKGVNDRVEVLAKLMRDFVELGIRPYYLHHPDLAPGTSHFRLSLAEGQALVAALRGHVSGLCQPLYILDIPGGYGKVPAAASPIEKTGDSYRITDFHGATHLYREN
ncbi:lysine-2,3-aminomutase-like protein [Allorhizobium sp. BGMRC 0089]|uniref:lysine-2,3-aminomutase-like protein n=1 Tax=Allorhizobium sonneratiae TaxID=2934936 RepID=UPI0020344A12|nr:lysine-2,3-aminomutase-like protein [Allorhizobium sonneratiae]MCM2294725.1 lysine-2,3-aminomutase-like protein [Allorhizobium sonneratiae]